MNDFIEPDNEVAKLGLYFDYTKYADSKTMRQSTDTILNYGKSNAERLTNMLEATRIVKDKESAEEYIQYIYDVKMSSITYILNKFRAGDEAYMRGFLNYGDVVNTYVLIHGSVPGPAKRLVRLRDPTRAPKGANTEAADITYISTASKQGA